MLKRIIARDALVFGLRKRNYAGQRTRAMKILTGWIWIYGRRKMNLKFRAEKSYVPIVVFLYTRSLMAPAVSKWICAISVEAFGWTRGNSVTLWNISRNGPGWRLCSALPKT